MESAGFTAEDYEPEPVEIWPENWPAWQLFCDISGQWRYSFGGKEALDYTPLFVLMNRMNLNDDEWDCMFHDIKAIEYAAIAQMRAAI